VPPPGLSEMGRRPAGGRWGEQEQEWGGAYGAAECPPQQDTAPPWCGWDAPLGSAALPWPGDGVTTGGAGREGPLLLCLEGGAGPPGVPGSGSPREYRAHAGPEAGPEGDGCHRVSPGKGAGSCSAGLAGGCEGGPRARGGRLSRAVGTSGSEERRGAAAPPALPPDAGLGGSPEVWAPDEPPLCYDEGEASLSHVGKCEPGRRPPGVALEEDAPARGGAPAGCAADTLNKDEEQGSAQGGAAP